METAERGWAKYAPGLVVLRNYQRHWLRADVLAGLTVCAYLIPQVMAYAQMAGLPTVVGLWGSCAPLLVYALVGGSRILSVGPESATALMTAAAIAGGASALGVSRAHDIAAVLALVVGLLAIFGWMARLGFISELLSRPVLAGYLIGIAVLMFTSQLGKVTRLTVEGDSPVEQLVSVAVQWRHIHVPTLLLAVAALVALFLLAWRRPTWPTPLIVMLAAAGVAIGLGAEHHGLEVIGRIPQGLPRPSIPTLEGIDWIALVPFAAGIAIVAYSTNMLTVRAFSDSANGERIEPGQEMLALGLTNLAAGLFQGFPVSSSSTRTALADSMDGRTQVYSLVTLAGLLGVLLVAGPVLESFPVAALGAVIIYAATRLVRLTEIRRLVRFRRSEGAIVLGTAIFVVVFGVMAGMGLAVVISILNLVRRIARPHDGILGYVPGLAGMHNIDDYPDATQVPGLVVYRYDAPIVFANANNFLSRALSAVDEAPNEVEWFVLNAEANTEVDATAVDALHDLRIRLGRRGIVFAMARVKQGLFADLSRLGFVQEVGEDRIFATLPTAVAGYAIWHRDRFGMLPEGIPPGLPGL